MSYIGMQSTAMNIPAAIASAFIVAGCFLPWIQMGALMTNRGIDNPDGMIILAVSLIGLIVSFASKKRNVLVNLLVALVCGITGTIDYKDVSQRIESTIFGSGLITVGYGIYLILIGSGMLFIVAIIDAMRGNSNVSMQQSNPQGEVDLANNNAEKTPVAITQEKPGAKDIY